ncbi:MAG: hypothetical protein ACLP50_17235 [Solirubrobacteraceae bacterium]
MAVLDASATGVAPEALLEEGEAEVETEAKVEVEDETLAEPPHPASSRAAVANAASEAPAWIRVIRVIRRRRVGRRLGEPDVGERG